MPVRELRLVVTPGTSASRSTSTAAADAPVAAEATLIAAPTVTPWNSLNARLLVQELG